MQAHELESRLASYDFRIACLERAQADCPAPGMKLMIAVEQTISVLEQWQEDKKESLTSDDFDDYRDVIATLPILKKAYLAWLESEKVK